MALDNWHRTHTHCPRCGAPTESEQGGWQRRCVQDGSTHFPRTDPAVIMLVHDGADRCLLGRQPTWPEHRFSCLAGFVESGESAEGAVVREVAEEVGVTVTDVSYRSSQPWPFPCSLMLGYRARATDERITLPDGEIAEARWLTRQQLRDAMASGDVLLPPPVSIAHQLITEWLEE
jgi:NAD+ diphosphatase